MEIAQALRRLGVALAAVLTAAAVLLGGFFVFLHTGPGERWMSGKAEEAVAGLELDGFRLGWPFRMRADHLRLSDERGLWLAAKAPELVWHPHRLWWRVLDIDRLAAERIEVRRLPEGGGGEDSTMPLPDAIRVDEVRLPISLAAPVLGQPLALELNGTARMERGGGPVEMSLRAQDGGFIRVAGIAGTDYVDLRWYLHLPNLSSWQHWAGMPLSGAAGGAGVVAGRLPSPEISGRLDSTGSRAGPLAWKQLGLTVRAIPDGPLWRGMALAEIAEPRVDGRPLPVAGASLSVLGDVAPADGRIRIGDGRLLTPILTAQASGVVEQWGRRAVLRLAGHGPALGGRVSARGVAAGNLLDSRASAVLTVTAAGTATGAAPLDSALGPRPRAQVAVDIQGGRVWLGPSRLDGAAATLLASGAVLPRLDLWTRLVVPQTGPLLPSLDGAVTASAHVTGTAAAPSAAGIAALHGITMAGAPPGDGVVVFDLPEPARPRGTLSAQMAVADTPLTAQARLDRGKGIRLGDLRLVSGESQIRGDLEFGPGVRGRLTGSIPQLQQWQRLLGRPLSGRIEAEAILDPAQDQSLRLVARGSGIQVAGLDVAAASLRLGATGLGGATRRLDIEEAAMTASHIPIRLTAPATVTWREGAVTVPAARLAVGSGQAELSGQMRGTALSARLRLDALPLALAAAEATGTVAGTIDAEGSPTAPLIRFALTGRDLGLTSGGGAGLGRLRGRMDGDWQAGRLRGRAELSNGQALSLMAEGSAMVPAGGAVEARLQASGDARRLAEAFPLGDHLIAGQLDAAAAVTGTIAAPSLSGHAVLRAGRYENLASGTVISALHAEAMLNGDRIDLTARGNDGGRGSVSMSGSAHLDGRYGGDIAFNHFTALRRDDVEAAVNGTLRLEGSDGDGRLSGQVTVPRAEINVGRLKGSGPVHLDVIEINRPGQPPGPPRTRQPEAEGPAPEIALAVHTVVEHAFVRGRGLDSEWQGTIDAGGTTAQPSLTGRLTAARGQYDILGKSFRLTADSAVIFQGGGAIDPVLDVTAEAAATDITAQARLTGTAKAPEMTFTSSPPLPQDEVLARLLFGREVGKLSAFQQIQLAQLAAGGLTGDQGGFDPIGDLRGFLGLDVLGVGSETDRAGKDSPTLSAGRYIGRDTFVRVDQGTAGLGKVTVEQSLGGGFSLESSVGEQSGGGVGVTWRKDY